MLNFIIPVRHPQSVPDWSVIKRLLPQTFASIAAQDSDEWQAVVVANRGADLPPMPPKFQLVSVDFPLNSLPSKAADREAFYNAVRDDKGGRIYAGIEASQATGHIMVVDYDDLISRRLASTVRASPNAPGWYIPKGYDFDDGKLVATRDSFNEKCGTSLIVRADLLSRASAEPLADHVRYVLGSHKFIKRRLQDRGTPLSPIAWRAACYRVGHAHSTDGSSGVIDAFSIKNLARRPRSALAQLARLRPLTRSLRREFWGDHG